MCDLVLANAKNNDLRNNRSLERKSAGSKRTLWKSSRGQSEGDLVTNTDADSFDGSDCETGGGGSSIPLPPPPPPPSVRKPSYYHPPPPPQLRQQYSPPGLPLGNAVATVATTTGTYYCNEPNCCYSYEKEMRCLCPVPPPPCCELHGCSAPMEPLMVGPLPPPPPSSSTSSVPASLNPLPASILRNPCASQESISSVQRSTSIPSEFYDPNCCQCESFYASCGVIPPARFTTLHSGARTSNRTAMFTSPRIVTSFDTHGGVTSRCHTVFYPNNFIHSWYPEMSRQGGPGTRWLDLTFVLNCIVSSCKGKI